MKASRSLPAAGAETAIGITSQAAEGEVCVSQFLFFAIRDLAESLLASTRDQEIDTARLYGVIALAEKGMKSSGAAMEMLSEHREVTRG